MLCDFDYVALFFQRCLLFLLLLILLLLLLLLLLLMFSQCLVEEHKKGSLYFGEQYVRHASPTQCVTSILLSAADMRDDSHHSQFFS